MGTLNVKSKQERAKCSKASKPRGKQGGAGTGIGSRRGAPAGWAARQGREEMEAEMGRETETDGGRERNISLGRGLLSKPVSPWLIHCFSRA